MKIDLLLPSGKYTLLKIEDGGYDFQVNNDPKFRPESTIFSYCSLHSGVLFKELPKAKHELIGPVSSITEEQAKRITPLYFNEYSGIWAKDTALESFHSWLKANHIYTDNPYGKEPTDTCSDIFSVQDDYNKRYKQWSEAQKRTGNWVLLKLLK